MSDFEIFDRRYRDFIPGNAFLEKLWTGARWVEGPVYFADLDCLLFSDIPNNRILRWAEGAAVSVFRFPSNYANGNTRDREGRLVSCEHGARRVTRTEYDGTVTVLADNYRGRRLNSPNDVAVSSDGSVWFTDPPYGILTDYEGCKAEQELDGCYLFRLDPARGELAIAAEDFNRPNGLAFSPDESILYVSDTARTDNPGGPPHIRAFNLKEDGRLSGGRIFADMRKGRSDGLRLDTGGNVWTSAADAVHCYTPEGVLALRIQLPEAVSNLTFGGPKRNRLFITARTSLYSIFVGVNGAQKP
jgi:gluconolactonase